VCLFSLNGTFVLADNPSKSTHLAPPVYHADKSHRAESQALAIDALVRRRAGEKNSVERVWLDDILLSLKRVQRVFACSVKPLRGEIRVRMPNNFCLRYYDSGPGSSAKEFRRPGWPGRPKEHQPANADEFLFSPPTPRPRINNQWAYATGPRDKGPGAESAGEKDEKSPPYNDDGDEAWDKKQAALRTKKKDYERRKPELQRQLEKEARDIGGKGIGLKRLQELADEIGFNVPETSILTVREGFAEYLEANRELVRAGDIIVEHKDEMAKRVCALAEQERDGLISNENMRKVVSVYFREIGIEGYERYFNFKWVSTSPDDVKFMFINYALTDIAFEFRMPDSVVSIIPKKIDEIGVDSPLGRTSGRKEDGFYKNLAGEYKSETISSKNAEKDVGSLFWYFINGTWIKLDQKIADDGCAVCFQEYLGFDAGFVGFSSLYGSTVMDVVCGVIEGATGTLSREVENLRSLTYSGTGWCANSTVFEIDGENVDCIRTFKDYPASITSGYKTRIYKKEEVVSFWEEHTQVITLEDSRNFRSPITLEQAKEVGRVLKALEEKLGYPVDVEGGFINGKLYLVQARPVTALAYAERGKLPDTTKNMIGEQTLAVGKIDFTGHIVYSDSTLQDTKSNTTLLQRYGNHITVRKSSYGDEWKPGPNSKVCIDLVSGERLKHDFHDYHKLIESGEYCYVVGTIIADAINSLEYEEVDGLTVSRRKVRVVADGLKARLYLVPEEEAPLEQAVTAVQKDLAENAADASPGNVPNGNVSGGTEEAYSRFLTQSLPLISTLFAESREPVFFPVSTAIIDEAVDREGMIALLNTLQRFKNTYVWLYDTGGRGRFLTEEEKKTEYRIDKKDIDKAHEAYVGKRENTVALFPVSQVIEEGNLRIELAKVRDALELREAGPIKNTIMSPVGAEGDPCGLIRGILLGVDMAYIARQNRQYHEVDDHFKREFIEPQVLTPYREHCESLGIQGFNLTAHDLIAIATGSPGLIEALQNLIRTLPPITSQYLPNEVKQTYESTRLMLKAL
jgi:hypothetical protein